ncbi:hypothetical protein [uncultured Psychrobacter sp.]|uniref:hypothetical protein n=1 Tax=uncultured Psychrobacter sp. TaxID=259303 RepID=UPI0025923347|nr:hypothetical protein [uncultured Psychrobacter sp.]
MKNSMKLTLLTTAMAAVMSLTACQKPAEEAPQPEAETDVPMSAEPAEGNDPVIVADDLDDVDANSESVTEGEAENGSMAANADETDVKEPVSVETQPVDAEQTPDAEEAPQQ